MALARLLGTANTSPPRSPHTAPAGYFDAAFPPSSTSSSSSGFSRIMSGIFRPTRRDLLLCLLTLSFSYLLFSSPPTSDPVTHPHSSPSPHAASIGGGAVKGGGGGKWVPWTGIFRSGDKCLPSSSQAQFSELSFTDSVRPHGVQGMDDLLNGAGLGVGVDAAAGSGSKWLVGEEDEDDEDVIVPVQGETVMKAHQPGWTIFDQLYLYNGSYYVVTQDKRRWPELRYLTSTGLPAIPGNGEEREPKGHEILFITPLEAAKLWGPRVYRMEGMTWLFNDGQFIDHYYHFAAELLMGTWRTYASLDPDITAQGITKLPPPRRIWFLHQHVEEWRDKPKFNPTILFNLFPSTAILYPEDFADLANSTSSNEPSAFVMDRALLADRSAAFRTTIVGSTARTVAGASLVGTASRWWWEPIRRQMLRYAGVSEEILDRSLEGYGAIDPVSMIGGSLGPGVSNLEPLAPQGTYTPVVTYISRQGSRRHLKAASHDALVKALTERSKKLGFELVIVEAERMTKEEQFALAGRTTIMLGVHGNGLTHLIWMPATPRTAVIEMYIAGGFAPDYQWTAHALGMKHFGVAKDIVYTSPNLPEIAYPEGFHGTEIEIDAKVVADIVEDRLTGRR